MSDVQHNEALLSNCAPTRRPPESLIVRCYLHHQLIDYYSQRTCIDDGVIKDYQR